MHCLVSHGGVAEAATMAIGPIEDSCRQLKLVTLASLLAAVVHDYEHEGVNNDFLVKTLSNRSTVYHDKSPNENHHVASAFRVIQSQECNFLEAMSVKELRQLKSLVVQMVLATDMAEHGNLLKKFKEVAAQNALNKSDATGAIAFSEGDATVVLQIALKCADLGHLAMPWSCHIRWVQRLEEEFFTQGDKERKEGMPDISFMMDRNKKGASDTQVGFFDFVVLPLFRELAGALPAVQPMLSAVEDNYHKWQTIQAELEACA